MTKKRDRNRKSRGSLSVMDEFTDSAEGSVVFSPNLTAEELQEIEHKTRSADVPISMRSDLTTKSADTKITLSEQNSSLERDSQGPTEHVAQSDLSSFRANKDDAKVSEHSRSDIGAESGNISEQNTDISEQIRSNVGVISEQVAALIPPIFAKEQSISEKYRSNIGAISDEVSEHGDKLSEQSRSSIGAKKVDGSIKVASKVVKQFSSPSPKSKSEQYRSNIGAISDQYRSVGASQSLIRSNVGAGSGSISEQELIFILPPLDRKIVCFFASLCLKKASLQTPPLTYEQIAGACSTSVETAKTQVKRLEKRLVIQRVLQKRGPGSWTVFELPQSVYEACLRYNSVENHFEDFGSVKAAQVNSIGAGIGASKGVQPSSSSNIYNNITTNTEESDQWNQIIIPEFLKRHGFSVTHAKQVLGDKENKLSFEQVQDSFNNFAIDLENNKVTIKTTPVRYFMSVIRSQRVPYESAFVTEQSRLEVEEYLKRVRSEVEICKQKAQVELVMKFKEWMSSLTQEQKNEIIKPNEMIKEGSHLQELQLRAYYQKLNGIDL